MSNRRYLVSLSTRRRGAAKVPEWRVLLARNMDRSDSATHGGSGFALREVQVLRGSFRNWAVGSWVSGVHVRDIDVLPPHADGDPSNIDCLGPGVLARFGALLEDIRATARNDELWGWRVHGDVWAAPGDWETFPGTYRRAC